MATRISADPHSDNDSASREGSRGGTVASEQPARCSVEGVSEASIDPASALPDGMTLDEARALTHGYFDSAHYRGLAPEGLSTDDDLLLHFLSIGWRLGLDPGPHFEVGFYLDSNPDVAASGQNPLLHFVRFGYWEQRAAARDAADHAGPGAPPILPNAGQLGFARNLTAAYFDEMYYRAQNPDLTVADGDAFKHFLVWGWRAGLNPGPKFDVRAYLAAYHDVAESDQNPLLHFVRYGAQEGRVARAPGDLWTRELDRAWEERGEAAARCRLSVPATLDARATAALLDVLRPASGQRGLALVLSHDDYAVSTGGVQNVVGDEQAAMHAARWGHLHISPVHSVLRLAENVSLSNAIYQLRLDGQKLGTLSAASLNAALRTLRDSQGRIQPIVHHLAGFAPEHVLELVAAAGERRPIVWVHDFFTVCESHALMRNNVAYCGGPPIGSMGCTICAYGSTRAVHVERLRSFFDRCCPDVLAPSASALDTWRQVGFAHHSASIIPLARLEFDSATPGRAEDEAPRPIRVAHLGGRSLMKGWTVFDRLAERYGDGQRYEFYQLGWQEGPRTRPGLRTVSVDVRQHGRFAMIQAVRDNQIDVAVCWSACAETFCFTAHEALAGGAFVIARRGAGNVWPAVRDNAAEQGLALDNETALFALFADDTMPEFLARPRRHGRLLPGRGSIDFLEARTPTWQVAHA